MARNLHRAAPACSMSVEAEHAKARALVERSMSSSADYVSNPVGAERVTQAPRRRALLAATAGIAAPRLLRAQPRILYINSQGGSWEASAKKNLFGPFTARTGIEIQTAPGASF